MLGARPWKYRRTICSILYGCLLGKALTAQVPGKLDYARHIQPILRDHCVECHGPSQQMRGFRLDRRRDTLPNRVGANGARIVPGTAAEPKRPGTVRTTVIEDTQREKDAGAGM